MASDICVDISPFLSASSSPADQASTANALLRAAGTHGYAHVRGHRVPTSVQARLMRHARRFFTCASEAERRQLLMPTTTAPTEDGCGPFRGYQPLLANITEGKPDSHHALDYMRTLPSTSLSSSLVTSSRMPLHTIACGRNVFPKPEAHRDGSEDGLESAMHEFVSHAVTAGVAVMRAVAVGMQLPPDAFDTAFDDPFWIIRIIHYPDAGIEDATAVVSTDDFLGCGAHRDYGFVTFVMEDDAVAAETGISLLQVANGSSNETECAEKWTHARVPDDGNFVVNFGDCLEAATAGALPATLHRVLRPRGRDRVSVAVFIEPNFEWPISTLLPESHPRRVYAERALERFREFRCYGEYLYRKVSTNFGYVDTHTLGTESVRSDENDDAGELSIPNAHV